MWFFLLPCSKIERQGCGFYDGAETKVKETRLPAWRGVDASERWSNWGTVVVTRENPLPFGLRGDSNEYENIAFKGI